MGDLDIEKRYLRLPLPQYTEDDRNTMGERYFATKWLDKRKTTEHLPKLSSLCSKVWSDANFTEEILDPFRRASFLFLQEKYTGDTGISTDPDNEDTRKAIDKLELVVELVLRQCYSRSTKEEIKFESTKLPLSFHSMYNLHRTEFTITTQNDNETHVGAIQYVKTHMIREELAEFCAEGFVAHYDTSSKFMEKLLHIISSQCVKYLFSSKCKRFIMTDLFEWLYIELLLDDTLMSNEIAVKVKLINSDCGNLFSREALCAFLWQDWANLAKALSDDQISKLISFFHSHTDSPTSRNEADTNKTTAIADGPANLIDTVKSVDIIEAAETDYSDDDENSSVSTTAVYGEKTPWYGPHDVASRPFDEELFNFLKATDCPCIEYYRDGRAPIIVESIMEGPNQWGQIRKVRFPQGNAVVEKAWDKDLFKNDSNGSAESMNTAEICAYQMLRELQGNVIPWYYGRGVRLNGSYDCVPLLLVEHIEGETLRNWLNGKRSKSDIDVVKCSFTASLRKLHNANWVHNSIYARNVIVQKDLRVVLIDLQRAARRDGDEN